MFEITFSKKILDFWKSNPTSIKKRRNKNHKIPQIKLTKTTMEKLILALLLCLTATAFGYETFNPSNWAMQGVYNPFTKQYHYIDLSTGVPDKFALFQNHPNPFNAVTTIQYALDKDKFVLLKVFDLTGNELVTLVKEYQTAGYHEVNFNGSNLSTGVYFYRIETDQYVSVKKMFLIK